MGSVESYGKEKNRPPILRGLKLSLIKLKLKR
jgi:hypothetical protein